MRLLAGIALVTVVGVAAAQPAPGKASDPGQERPATTQKTPPAQKPLNLTLDPSYRPAVTFVPEDKKKRDGQDQGLPGLGGNPSKELEQPSTSGQPVIPITNPNIE